MTNMDSKRIPARRVMNFTILVKPSFLIGNIINYYTYFVCPDIEKKKLFEEIMHFL